MKKILLLIAMAMVCGLGFAGCAGSKSTSIRTVNVGPEAVRPLPLTADLNVSEQKVRGEAQGRVGADFSAEDRIVREAVARALGQDPPRVEAPDVLLAMNVYKEPRGKDSLRVVVTGYPAWYHNFRTVAETSDSAWLVLTNTSGVSVRQSGEGGQLFDPKKQWLLGMASKSGGSKNKGKGHYLGVSRRLEGSISENEWLAIEAGWKKRSGLFYGFELGGGTSNDDYSVGVGFNIGKMYALPLDVEVGYGVSLGSWVDRYLLNAMFFEVNTYNIGIVGPVLKARWKFVEFTYRGLIGASMSISDNEFYENQSKAEWYNQYRAGLYFEF